MLAHHVYFTLKDRSPDAAARLVASAREHLSGHPGTLAFAVGTVAAFDRQVNDRDFDVALTIVFDSHAAHDAYQKAERHDRFLAESAATWARVRVFDADLAAFTATPPAPATR
ncbi:MAG: Dabb family protein [Proteobacteria bacterium]|nr:Dabb family protein [Pseudomonadota bacterium]